MPGSNTAPAAEIAADAPSSSGATPDRFVVVTPVLADIHAPSRRQDL
jgi:hypothetical protein